VVFALDFGGDLEIDGDLASVVERHNEGMHDEEDSGSKLSKQDVQTLTVAFVEAVIAVANRRLSKKAEVRKTILDATFKSLGKMAEEGLKELSKTSGYPVEILLPLSSVSGVAVEELGKAFGQSILTLSDSTNNKLTQILDQSLKAGFELALMSLTVHPKTQAGKDLQSRQTEDALTELTRAANVERNQSEVIAIRWMQTLLCLRIGAREHALEYLKPCVSLMRKMRTETMKMLDEQREQNLDDRVLLEMYKRDPNSVDLDWPTKNPDWNGQYESAEEYNRRQFSEAKPAMGDPVFFEAHVNMTSERERRQQRLVRLIDYFIDLSNQ
jgi:hypothetical protein